MKIVIFGHCSVNLADEHCLSDFEAESVKVKKLIKSFVMDELNNDEVKDETNTVGKVEHPERNPEKIFRSLPKVSLRVWPLYRYKFE